MLSATKDQQPYLDINEECKSPLPTQQLISENDDDGMFYDAMEALQSNSFIQNKFQSQKSLTDKKEDLTVQ